MKRFLLAGLVLFIVAGANAQTTKVSKKIEVLSWLNEAVVNGNQVYGGLHSYQSWTDVLTGTPSLQINQVQLGMFISILDDNATYRLKEWDDNTALPLKSEWERVGDVVVVADMTARTALLTAGSASLAVGTVVVVKSNALAVPEAFIYVEDMDGNGTPNENDTDSWYSFSGAGTSNGYIYFVQVAVADPYASDLSSLATSLVGGYINNGSDEATAQATITAATDAKLSSLVPVTISLANSSTNVVIAIPKAWTKPNFYLNDGTSTYSLNDCWVNNTITKDGIDYQLWVADNQFTASASATLSLIVR